MPDGRVVIIAGPHGIGKTRLVEELAAAIRAAGGGVLAVTCYQDEQDIAFGAVADLLREGLARTGAGGRLAAIPEDARLEAARLVPAYLPSGAVAAPPPMGPWARTRLLDALATCLTVLVDGPAPGLVVVDDLHWADGSTLETLAYLARRLAGRSMLLVVTVRPEDVGDAADAVLRALERRLGPVTIHLGGLDAEAVRRLAAAAGTGVDATALARESDGLPLFVVEALASPRPPGGLPAGVRALLEERIDRAGEVAAQVLVALAVIGRSADLPTVRGTSGRSDDETVAALEELVARGLLREAPGEVEPVYDLAHPVLREVVLERISLARRRLLHHRAAEALRAAAPRLPDLGRLARIAGHEQAAGRDREAARAHRDAGELARLLYANREAIVHLGAALALGHEDESAIHEALGELRTRIGDYAAAIASLERAAATADGPRRLAPIERRLALAHQRLGDHGSAMSHLEAALALLGTDDPTRLRLAAEQAVVALGSGDRDLAAERALAVLAAAGDDPVAAAHAHRVLGLVAAARDDRQAARTALDASLVFAGAADDPGLVIAARNALALVTGAAGDTAAALEHGAAALVEARRTGDLHLEAAVESNLADVLHAAGRDAESREHQLRAVALFADVGGRPGELQPEIWKLSAW